MELEQFKAEVRGITPTQARFATAQPHYQSSDGYVVDVGLKRPTLLSHQHGWSHRALRHRRRHLQRGHPGRT